MQEHYYVHRPHGAPLGKLYNKYHNWKNGIRSTQSLSEPVAKKRKAQEITYDESESDMEHMRALKFDNLGHEDKMLHWKGCIATRLNSFKKRDAHFSKLWPMYREPGGYRLVRYFLLDIST